MNGTRSPAQLEIDFQRFVRVNLNLQPIKFFCVFRASLIGLNSVRLYSYDKALMDPILGADFLNSMRCATAKYKIYVLLELNKDTEYGNQIISLPEISTNTSKLAKLLKDETWLIGILSIRKNSSVLRFLLQDMTLGMSHIIGNLLNYK